MNVDPIADFRPGQTGKADFAAGSSTAGSKILKIHTSVFLFQAGICLRWKYLQSYFRCFSI